VTVHQIVVEGNAGRVLLDASKDADLLVVGSRGHGGFADALIGSVSVRCLQHATCPVVSSAPRSCTDRRSRAGSAAMADRNASPGVRRFCPHVAAAR